MPDSGVAIVWFRLDLRLADNPALVAASHSGEKVIPLYVYDEEGEGDWPMGAASKWWLHHSLISLGAALERKGARLVIRRGNAQDVLAELCSNYQVSSVYWNRRYEPAVVARDTEIKRQLAESGITARSFNGALLQSPLSVKNKSDSPFKVFTPFWKHIRVLNTRKPEPEPEKITTPGNLPESEPVESLDLLPKISWDKGFYEEWTPGENGAKERLNAFSRAAVASYSKDRDMPAKSGVSKLSPHLHFGELSPCQIWHGLPDSKSEPYLRQLAWREFSHHLLFHFPDTAGTPLRDEFAAFPWKKDADRLAAWQKGLTGFPLVDAGMRELWATGWMHNRVRMVAASFLVKHLLQPWQEGAKWFWDTLVDADLANNTMGWQWVAGCGADAAPYFRVFNPIAQGERFDKSGEYTRKWVPELAKLPDSYLFCPWDAPQEVLQDAGVVLGDNYPNPIVSHQEGRESALAAYQKMKDAS